MSLLLLHWFYGHSGLRGGVFWLSCGYLVLTISYSAIFRSIPVVDVLTLGLGFVLRVAVGALALNLAPTGWLLGCTYAVSLMLGFGKRLGELRLLTKRGLKVGDSRSVLLGYSEALLCRLIGGCSLSAAGLYLAYCLTRPERFLFLLSLMPVMVGLTSYLRIAFRSEQAEMPEKLFLKNPLLAGSVIFWVLLITLIGFQRML